jgi:hypothetical protein
MRLIPSTVVHCAAGSHTRLEPSNLVIFDFLDSPLCTVYTNADLSFDFYLAKGSTGSATIFPYL